MSEIDWNELAEVYDHFNSTRYNVVLPMFCTWVVERLDERVGQKPQAGSERFARHSRSSVPGESLPLTCETDGEPSRPYD